jgi:glycosyltransferase involved in cell wall biosynthesis
MRIAFYAPLKSPDHPVPSGDRQIGRALLSAMTRAGHDVALASRFRSYDGGGDNERQARLRAIGARVAGRLVRRWQHAPPDVFFTYHVYHKAPDLLGPAVGRALRVPYVVAEASSAARHGDGPWAVGHALALQAIRAADAVISLNPKDEPEVRRARGPGATSLTLAPFIDVDAFVGASTRCRPVGCDDAEPRLVTTAMMRDGAKLASYRVLAAALTALRDRRWTLRVIGDGPARGDVEHAFAALGTRVSFLGERPAAAIAAELADSDLFVWPAIDEAIGLAFIEAQACGVPVVGAQSPGVAAVIAAGRTGLLAPPADVGAFVAATRALLDDAGLRRRMAADARAYVRERHDVGRASAELDTILRDAVAGYGRARSHVHA